MHLATLLAHAGHAGDHGWLAGALQPLLSLDHLAASLLVAALLSLGLLTALRQRGLVGTSDRR